MAIFGNASVRLLREDWPNPTALAQELFAIFNSDNVIDITSPVKITAQTPEAPLQVVNQTSDTAAGIQVVGNQVVQGSTYTSGEQLGFVPSGTTQSTVGGQNFVPGTNPVYTFPGGQLTVTLSSSSTTSSANSQTGLSVSIRTNVFIGSVVSGDSQIYRVKLLGSSSPGGTTVDVLFPELASTETLPVGSFAFIIGVQTSTLATGSPVYSYYGVAPKSLVSDTFVGTVVSGSGQTYQIKIMGTSSVGGKTVSVTFPMLSVSETIPVNATIVGITRVQVAADPSGTPLYSYYGYVPVWIS